MAKPGMTQPDLVTDLSALQKRLDDLERKPVPTTLYDTYPCMNWETVGRGIVGSNMWSSVGIANVTGMKYDRVEAKFITDKIIAERSEAEIRMAAFKHSHDSHRKTCVAASSTVRLTGNWDAAVGNSVVGVGKWRWIHNLPRGWNLDSEDQDAIYTIELQHRYNDSTPQKAEPAAEPRQVFGYYKDESFDASVWGASTIASEGTDPYRAPALKKNVSSAPDPQMGWTTANRSEAVWDGSYRISNMHYCVGMAAEQLPEASESGWFWYSGGDAEFVRQPDIEEYYISY